MTDPDWVPIMKRAAAIVTDHGGRTSHAAIVSRELGVPAIVGTGNATHVLHDQQEVTVSCAEGDEGFVYQGTAEFDVKTLDVTNVPATETKVMLNLANPGAVFRWWKIPADGVGLARMEFVIDNHIRIHPMALVHYDTLKDEAAKKTIAELTVGYDDKSEYFVDRLSRGLARIAATVYPKPVIVRMSDFKTNEYAGLIGGREFEPRGREPDDRLPRRLALLLAALPRGLRAGVQGHAPATRRDGLRQRRDDDSRSAAPPRRPTRCWQVMAENGLKRGERGLQVYVMCEIPSNVILAKEFAKRFDGFSIGSNDLTQLTLGVDRDSGELAGLFDEQDPAVEWMIESVITAANRAGAKIGLCGQAPSDHPEFAGFLVACGIDSVSVNPDSFIAVKKTIAEKEAALKKVSRKAS